MSCFDRGSFKVVSEVLQDSSKVFLRFPRVFLSCRRFSEVLLRVFGGISKVFWFYYMLFLRLFEITLRFSHVLLPFSNIVILFYTRLSTSAVGLNLFSLPRKSRKRFKSWSSSPL